MPQCHAGALTQRRSPVSTLDIGVYVPQMGFSYPDLLHRARRCEKLGIGSLWLYDHL